MDNIDQGYVDDFMKLADEIAKTLWGKRPYLILEINAYSLAGKMQEVYPSEKLLLDKEKTSKKSKVLYEVKGASGDALEKDWQTHCVQ